MQKTETGYQFSPSDLITYMDSEFASAMDRKVLSDPVLADQMDPPDELMQSLAKKGYAHEADYVEDIKSSGRDITEIVGSDNAARADATIAAMKAGQEVITQGYITDGVFAGLADFLVRVPGASDLGDWRYEVWDAKLSKSLKPYFAVQLCCYSEMLANIQGVLPADIVVVTGDKLEHRLRLTDYYFYYQNLRERFLAFHSDDGAPTPDPALSKSHGRWSDLAARLLKERDHLSLVANIRRSQIEKLEAAGISTLSELATTELARVPRLDDGLFERLRAQASLQLQSEGLAQPLYEVLRPTDERALGLETLPPASASDVFFDIEGLPTVENGLEYLWGATYYEDSGARVFRDFWGHNEEGERQAFTDFVDWVYRRWIDDPAMHIYHYAAYEITALRKLMGRHGLREFEVDTLLRNNVFVDLYSVVRNGLRVGEPKYSIKNIEHLYREARETDVASGGDSIVVYEAWRENPDGDSWETSDILRAIRDYNIDDCNSTEELARWLRAVQQEHGMTWRAPGNPAEAAEAAETERVDVHAALREALEHRVNQAGEIPFAGTLKLFSDCLDFHARENKPTGWRYFDRLDQTPLDLHDDAECLIGVKRTDRAPFREERARSDTYEYRFDIDQPFKGRPKNFHVLERENFKLKTQSYDAGQGLLTFRSNEEPPAAMTLIPDEYIRPHPIPDAMVDVIQQVALYDHNPRAITDFLNRDAPRFEGDEAGAVLAGTEDVLQRAIGAARALDNSYLCIQGPPGAGKTYTAKHVILDLLAAGNTVGISSNSHKAINHLMAETVIVGGLGAARGGFQKVQTSDEDVLFETHNVEHVATANKLSIRRGACVGGTAWCFSNTVCTDAFDYLFIDEAGQVSIANLIAMSRSARNLIFMGDQMQLAQPIQGDHPGDSGLSILDYLLQNKSVIPPDRGIFLPRTYRMHPDLCQIVSEQVYDGKLSSDGTCSDHVLSGVGGAISKSSGIQFEPVSHHGNQQSSPEEASKVRQLVTALLDASFGTTAPRQLTLDDILIVAPYNAQVNLLRQTLPDGARVGSVDLFQGQEAPVVIVSMAASGADEAPRGVDFLFSQNRLNVAISRAQALAIIVASPDLANTNVSRLDQVRQVNFFSRLSRHGRSP